MSGSDASETDTTTESTESTESDTDSTEKSQVDWKSRAREWEKRAKANASAADRLAELEESQKSETQKLADAKAKAEQDAAAAKADALRWRIAAKHGISDEDAELFLTGGDEETLSAQAERLSQRTSERQKAGNTAASEGKHPTAGTEDRSLRAVTRRLFDAASQE